MRLKLKYARAAVAGGLLLSVFWVASHIVDDEEGREIRATMKAEGGVWKVASTVAREWAYE